jgi:hypothetical protein
VEGDANEMRGPNDQQEVLGFQTYANALLSSLRHTHRGTGSLLGWWLLHRPCSHSLGVCQHQICHGDGHGGSMARSLGYADLTQIKYTGVRPYFRARAVAKSVLRRTDRRQTTSRETCSV